MQTKQAHLDWPVEDSAAAGDEYARYAGVYDVLFGDLSDDLDFYLARAAAVLEPNGAVLELGTGTGRVAARFLAAGHRVVGLEANAEMLALARAKLGSDPRFFGVQADVRTARLDQRFRLAVAPYGMVAHLLTDDDRRAAFRTTYEHLEPGGTFVFDDMPGWLAGAADGTQLEQRRVGRDPRTGSDVRLLSNCVDVAGLPLTVRYDFIDWLAGGEVEKRIVIRVVFRNIPLEDDLRLLRDAGFSDVELLGDFDGRPFDRDRLGSNHRLVVVARK